MDAEDKRVAEIIGAIDQAIADMHEMKVCMKNRDFQGYERAFAVYATSVTLIQPHKVFKHSKRKGVSL